MTYPASGRTVRTASPDPVHQVVGYGGAAIFALVVLACLPALLHPTQVYLDPGRSVCEGRTWGDDLLYASLWLLVLGCVAAGVQLATRQSPLWLAGVGVVGLLLAMPKATTVVAQCAATTQQAGSIAPELQRPLLLAGVAVLAVARVAYTRLH